MASKVSFKTQYRNDFSAFIAGNTGLTLKNALKIAENGDPWMYVLIALGYQAGNWNHVKDPVLAKEWFQKGCDAQDAMSYLYYGHFEARGLGGLCDWEKAEYRYQQGWNLGSAECLTALTNLKEIRIKESLVRPWWSSLFKERYHNYLKEILKPCFDGYHQALTAGDTQALPFLGRLYAYVNQLDKIREFLTDDLAKSSMEASYLKGYCIEQTGNIIEALKWYQRSAEAGYREAQHIMGLIYLEGKYDFKQDTEEGLVFLRNASAQKWTPSMVLLADLYFEGKWVNQSAAKAWIHYCRAEGNGYKDLIFKDKIIKALKEECKDDIAAYDANIALGFKQKHQFIEAVNEHMDKVNHFF